MSQHYSDPARSDDAYSLPNVEVFYMDASDFETADDDTWQADRAQGDAPTNLQGWYYWYCLPGCLPDSEPNGPYTTEQDAIDAAMEDSL